MTPGEIRRLYFIIKVFLSYGLDELIPRLRITLPIRLWRRGVFWLPNRHKIWSWACGCAWRWKSWGRYGSSSGR